MNYVLMAQRTKKLMIEFARYSGVNGEKRWEFCRYNKDRETQRRCASIPNAASTGEST